MDLSAARTGLLMVKFCMKASVEEDCRGCGAIGRVGCAPYGSMSKFGLADSESRGVGVRVLLVEDLL